MPEDVWKKNIDWLAEEFLPYGYDMAATDGWLFNLNSIDQYGYLTKYEQFVDIRTEVLGRLSQK